MSSDEEYLDSLLRSMENKETANGSEEPAEDFSVDEPEVAFPEPIVMPQLSDDPNAKMSADDIAALFAAMGGDEPAPAEEPVPVDEPMEEAAPAEESVPMEEPAAEPVPEFEPEPEPEPEPEAVPVAMPQLSDDPNAKMSADDIAALFAAMGGDEPAPAEEPLPMGESLPMEESAPEAAPAAMPQLSDDPNTKMSADDIAALFAAMGGDEPAPMEEPLPMADPVPAEEPMEEAAPTVEDAQVLTAEEIDRLLAAAEAGMDAEAAKAETGASAADADNADVLSLLGEISGDEGMDEISNLLNMSDNNEAIDADALQANEEAAMREIAELTAGIESGTAEESKEEKKAKKKAKKEKAKKEKQKKDGDDGGNVLKEKKGGFFGKLLSRLTEEEAEESDENENILRELEAEDAAEASKKKKVKKGKALPADEEEEAGEGKKGKKGKKQKAEKPKKEKAAKAKAAKAEKESIPEKPGKKISKKSIVVVVLFAATIFGVVFLASTLLSETMQKQRARTAFANRDYATCYKEMYGMNLSEEEEVMFNHAQIVLRYERRVTVYEKYLEDDRVVEALDSLMQALADYEIIYANAQTYGAEAEVAATNQRILDILQSDYGLDRTSAYVIAQTKNNVTYTRYLTALANGERIGIGNGQEGGMNLPEVPVEDILPEETEIIPPSFIN